MTDDPRAAPTPEATAPEPEKRYSADFGECVGQVIAELRAPEATAAPEPLTDLERFDATNSARIVGQRGGTVPAEPWTTLILRYEATLRASAPEPTLAGTHEETVVREVVKALTKTGYPRLAEHLRATVAALTAERADASLHSGNGGMAYLCAHPDVIDRWVDAAIAASEVPDA